MQRIYSFTYDIAYQHAYCNVQCDQMLFFVAVAITDKAVPSSVCGVANNGERCPRCCSALAPPVSITH